MVAVVDQTWGAFREIKTVVGGEEGKEDACGGPGVLYHGQGSHSGGPWWWTTRKASSWSLGRLDGGGGVGDTEISTV